MNFILRVINIINYFSRQKIQNKLLEAVFVETSANTAGNISKTASGFKKLLTPINEFDTAITIYRGTTGSEATSSILFATENAAVAASYVKNGGQVVSYRVSQFGLKSLESSGQLTYKTGMHGTAGTVSKEYVFKGNELIAYLNSIAAPLK